MCTASVFYHWYLKPDETAQAAGGGAMEGRPKPGAFGDTELGGQRSSSSALSPVHSVSPPTWARQESDIASPAPGSGGRRLVAHTPSTPPATLNPFGPGNPFGDEDGVGAPAAASFTIRPSLSGVASAPKQAVTFEL